MTDEWDQVVFADVIELISGGTPKTSVPEYWGGSIPWLSVVDFNTGYRWVSTAEKTITERGLAESATTILNQGDIIISARGTVGVVAQLALPMAFNQSCYGIRGKTGIAETNFVYYALRQAVSQMQQVAHGGVFNTITRDTFKIIQTKLPSLKEQRAIACILGALDDKIELNRKMNRTLETMVQAIFNSWFVDFDPVRAKAGGQAPGLPKKIADLFPNSFEDYDIGEIPKGWQMKPFADTIEIIGGGTPKTSISEYWDGDIPWFSVVDAPSDSEMWVIDTKKKITQEGVRKSSTQILSVGMTIITARGTVGRVALVGIPMAMNQSCYGLQGKADTIDKYGSFTYFVTRALVVDLQQHAHGSVFDTITRDTLAGVSGVEPPTDLIQAFEIHVHPIMERVRIGLLESRTLAALRDTLLPKLLTGEMTIKNAEKFV